MGLNQLMFMRTRVILKIGSCPPHHTMAHNAPICSIFLASSSTPRYVQAHGMQYGVPCTKSTSSSQGGLDRKAVAARGSDSACGVAFGVGRVQKGPVVAGAKEWTHSEFGQQWFSMQNEKSAVSGGRSGLGGVDSAIPPHNVAIETIHKLAWS